MRSRRTFLSLLAASLWCGFACIAQTSTNPSPAQIQNTSIEQATLLSSTRGYVTAGNRIFYTSTLGDSWVDITPKEAKGNLITGSFSSPSEGTAYYASAQNVGSNASIQVFKTSTQGASWSPLSSVSGGHALNNFGGSVETSSFDSQHVWLTVREASSTAFSFADLFSTVDGGKSWQLLPPPPVFGQLQFISPTIGFLLGGFSNSELYRTSNGGQSWVRIQFAEEKELNREVEVSLSLPRFESQSNGSLIVSLVKSGTTITTAYGTADGGVTWSKANARSLASAQAVRVGTDSGDPVVVQVQADSSVYTSHVTGTAKIFTLPKSFQNAVVTHASFIGDQVGLIVIHSGQSDQLMLTKDGGSSYVDVTPSGIRSQTSSAVGIQTSSQLDGVYGLPTPESVYPNNGPLYKAWDQKVAPSFAQLDDWGFTSPFHGVGIYLGGAWYSSTALAQSGLTPVYSYKLLCDGFSIIPLWVGSQVNTSRFSSSLVPADPTAAYSQGYSEGQQAVGAAGVELGLTSGIIYFDIEGYDEPTSFSVGRFVSGWTQALHDKGWQAGVYFAAKNWAEIIQSNPEPDDVWVVKISIPVSTSGGVYGLSPLPDSVWINSQRLRQYAQPTTPMTFGVHS